MVAQGKRVCKCGRPAMQGMSKCGRCYDQAYELGEVQYIREGRPYLTEAGKDYCRRHPNTETFDLTPVDPRQRYVVADEGRQMLAELEAGEDSEQ